MNAARKFLWPLFLIISMTCMVVPIQAQNSTNTIKSAVDTARDENRERRAKLPIAKGTLTELDLLRHQLKLKTEDGVRTFSFTARTYIFREKEKITPDKLKVGETIAVRFTTGGDGISTISRIKAQGTLPPPDAIPTFAPVATNQAPNAQP